MSCVIALSGTMGSGKSTLAAQAAATLPRTVVLTEDDFCTATHQSLSDVAAWWRRGGDVAEIDLSAVIRHLQGLLHLTDESRPQFVLLETQFGRLHPQLGPWIHRQCWIEVPPDVALARKFAQLAADLNQEPIPPHEALLWLHDFCRSYLSTTRPMFEQQRLRLRSVADTCLDGLAPPVQVLDQLLAAMVAPAAGSLEPAAELRSYVPAAHIG